MAKEGKWRGRKTHEKIFSPRPTKFILSNRDENAGEKSALTALLQKYAVLESSKKKKKKTERALEKMLERMRAGATPRTFLNEEDKENKRRGIEIRTKCVGKKKYG